MEGVEEVVGESQQRGIGVSVDSSTPQGRMYLLQLRAFDCLLRSEQRPPLPAWQALLLGAMAADDTGGVQSISSLMSSDRNALLGEVVESANNGSLEGMDEEMAQMLMAMMQNPDAGREDLR